MENRMKKIQSIQIDHNSNEEILPGFTAEFPYIATCVELNRYDDAFMPWHWHRPVELFYIQSGCLEYTTSSGRWIFPAGSGGFVNSNVLHTSSFEQNKNGNIQQLHIFDPSLIAGEAGSLIEQKYVLPLTADSGVQMIPLFPEDPVQADILKDILNAFELQESQWGYELKLRNILTDIWLKLFELAQPFMEKKQKTDGDSKIKKMMIYVHEHYQQPIAIEDLAESVPISKRACFRLFQEYLHTTPVEYVRSYRLQRACQMLARGSESVTQIAQMCGLGSSSYFGKVFRETYHCTPLEYRRKWHDCDSFLR